MTQLELWTVILWVAVFVGLAASGNLGRLQRRILGWSLLVTLAGALAPGCKCSTSEPANAGKPITELPPGTVFYLGDHQGTPVVELNADGEVIEATAHHPYGSVRDQRGGGVDPWSYVGNEHDRGSGLGDFRARPLRAKMAAFYSPDPVALFEPEKVLARFGNQSRAASDRSYAHLTGGYQYTANDPINSSDPDGELAPLVAAVAVGALAGVSVGALYYGSTAPENMPLGEFGVRFAGYSAGGAIAGGGAGLLSVPGIVGWGGALGGAGMSGMAGQTVQDVSSGNGIDPVRTIAGGFFNVAGGVMGAGTSARLLQASSYARDGAKLLGIKSTETILARELARAEITGTAAGAAAAVVNGTAQDQVVGEPGW